MTVLNAEQAAWLERGVCSIVVASRDPHNRPSLGWGMGCRASTDLRGIVVFLLEAQSHEALMDVRAGRPVSVLFTQATTTRALQLKASRAREVPLAPGDVARLDAYSASLAATWEAAGEPLDFTLALMSREGDNLVALEVVPEAAFDQTPGPRAGSSGSQQMTMLDEIRDSLEGIVPGVASSCSPDGTPNVCYISQVEYIDPEHVALSFQFFNKTRQNVLANPQVLAAVVDPESAAVHRLYLSYLRTETAGPVFERMRAKLASIAAATGLSEVFKLRGADIYRVERITAMPGKHLPKASRRRGLSALRSCSDALAKARDLGQLIDVLLEGLTTHFGIEHALVLAIDRAGGRFYTLASRGYGDSGVGAEIPLGSGTVGIAAAARVPIRLAHAAADYAYVRAIRETAAKDPLWAGRLELGIPFPGLAAPHSQLAVPIEADDTVLGVLYVESAEQRRFSHEDEDALVTLARQLGLSMRGYESDDEVPPSRAVPSSGGKPLTVKYFPGNCSVFCDEEYLIRGVAGAILWKLLRHFTQEGRTEFSNRELRLDRALGLPELADNLEARLVLLERRLREKDTGLLIHRTERGRFSLSVQRNLSLSEQR